MLSKYSIHSKYYADEALQALKKTIDAEVDRLIDIHTYRAFNSFGFGTVRLGVTELEMKRRSVQLIYNGTKYIINVYDSDLIWTCDGTFVTLNKASIIEQGLNTDATSLIYCYCHGRDLSNTETIITRPTVQKWQNEGLMPYIKNRGFLVWKHVTEELKGNLKFPYKVGEQYQCAAMACAGPFGALKDWHESDKTPHVIAILTNALYDSGYNFGVDNRGTTKGAYFALQGTPVALYRATQAKGDWVLELVDGEQALDWID